MSEPSFYSVSEIAHPNRESVRLKEIAVGKISKTPCCLVEAAFGVLFECKEVLCGLSVVAKISMF